MTIFLSRDEMNAEQRLAFDLGHAAATQQLAHQLEQAERDKARAVFIAEHLFQMVPKEAWREHGAEYMGQYEGDHWAEQTRDELAALSTPERADPGVR